MNKEYFSNLPLSSCSMNINGNTLERLVLGFKTSSVDGRDNIDIDIDTVSTSTRDGSRYKSKRISPRTLTIKFNLTAENMTEYNKLINKLKGYVSTPESKIIFNDEQEVYYIGTLKSLQTEQSDAGYTMRSYSGTMEFECLDPFKYSVEEKCIEATIDEGNTFVLDYPGTYKSYPRFEVKMTSDNGFVGFCDENNHVLQFGNVDEVDKKPYKASEKLVSIGDFANLNDDTSTSYMHPEYRMPGHLVNTTVNNADAIVLESLDNRVSGTWNGGMKTLTLPIDSNGEKGATNFYCYLNHWFETGLMGQTGEQTISFLTDDNRVICGYSLYKNDMVGNTASMEFWGNGRKLRVINFIPSCYDNHNPLNYGRGFNDIRKEGNKITFHWWGSYPTYVIPEIENMKCTKIQITIEQFSNRNLSNEYVTRNFFRSIDFWKMNVIKWNDVPNKFATNDLLVVDCETGSVKLKGLENKGLGAIGNDWENLCLKPGKNQIKCLHSSWARTPKIKMYYREVYL